MPTNELLNPNLQRHSSNGTLFSSNKAIQAPLNQTKNSTPSYTNGINQLKNLQDKKDQKDQPMNQKKKKRNLHKNSPKERK